MAPSTCLFGVTGGRRLAMFIRNFIGQDPVGVLEKFAAMQMIDVYLPTTDGRELVLTR